MNTKTKQRLFCCWPLFYWAVVILIGYLLIHVCEGTGNGNGRGGAGGGHGTGMTAAGDGDGGGEEDRNTAGNIGKQTSPQGAETDEGEQAQAANANQDESAPAGNMRDKKSNDGDTVQAADISLDNPVQRLSSAESGTPVRSNQDEDSKVISSAEAKKGFFGIEVNGRERAFFILDVSGSMASSTAEGQSRLELMKNIFAAEIYRLHQAASKTKLQSKRGCFIFASFSDSVKIYPQKDCFRYDQQRDVDEAKQKVFNLNIEGGTSILGAFTQLKNRIGNFQCDMVYLLTDGEPTDCSPEQMLKWLRQNMPRQKISTFSLGTHSQLLEDIAKQHHGKYREIH